MEAKEFLKDINIPNTMKASIDTKWRIILSPIMFVWFLIQTAIFSILLGAVSIFLGIDLILVSLVTGYNEGGVYFILSPFVTPFIWVYRYIMFGEYGTLI